MAKKKLKLIITHTLVTDGKIILSKKELVELIRLKYPEFPIGECTVDANYDHNYDNDDDDEYNRGYLIGITVQSTKSEKYES